MKNKALFVKKIYIAVAATYLSPFVLHNCQSMDQQKTSETLNVQTTNHEKPSLWVEQSAKEKIILGTVQLVSGGAAFFVLCPELAGPALCSFTKTYTDRTCSIFPSDGIRVCTIEDLNFDNFCNQQKPFSEEISHNPYVSYSALGLISYGAVNIFSGLSSIIVAPFNNIIINSTLKITHGINALTNIRHQKIF